jgi:hypothetical protein
MEVTVTYHEDRAICSVRIVGTITNRDDVRCFFGQALPILEEHGGTRVLFDLRNAEIAAGTMETYYTAADPGAWGWKRHYKAAVVYSNITERERFLETVGVNRGILIHIFDDIDEAFSWLAEEDTCNN